MITTPHLRLPQHLLSMPNKHRFLKTDGATVIESCHHGEPMQGTAFVTEYELIHIFEGRLTGRHGNQTGSIETGETLLIRKGTYFDFLKESFTPDAAYRSVLFFLKNEFIAEFMKTHPLSMPPFFEVSDVPFIKIQSAPTITGFVQSLLPYFEATETLQSSILKIKTFEFLLNLAALQPQVLTLFQQIDKPVRADLAQTMEQHFTKNLSLEQFAHLSGRSLSTFKREFEAYFNMPPARWLKERRLQLAKNLIERTAKNVTEIGFEVGFEDASHFTKAFKIQFGVLPKEARMGVLS
jgi:AraC family transcriptional regulator, exoenzyme S synthesis regulatory protein ExsA